MLEISTGASAKTTFRNFDGVTVASGPVSTVISVAGKTTGQLVDRLERFQGDFNAAMNELIEAVQEHQPE